MRWKRLLWGGLILAVGCRSSDDSLRKSDYPLRKLEYSEIVGTASIEVVTPVSIKRGDRFSVPILVDLGSVTMPKVGVAAGRLHITRQSATLGSCEIDVSYDPAILKIGPIGATASRQESGLVTLSARPEPKSGVIRVATVEFEVVGDGEMTTLTIAPRKVLTPEIPGLGSYSIPDKGPTISVVFFSSAGETASHAQPVKKNE